MKVLRTTYLLLMLLAGWQAVAVAQVDSTAVDSVAFDSAAIDTLFLYPPEFPLAVTDTTSLNTVATDTLFRFPPNLTALQDTTGQLVAEEKKELFKVRPWEFHSPLGADRTATDSTLRWQHWSDWTYKLSREPGIISYRLGTNIRSNAVQRNAHEPRHQQLYWEDISLNDPVSGVVNWGLIPENKIADFYTRDLGTVHESRFYHHQFYINKPLSRLIYSESKFNYRNLEFEVSHNLSQRTNVELSYWDRRSGGEYSNSEITGRQIYLKASHHLGQDKYLKLNYITNNYNIGQPFGYNMADMRTFNFDRYAASAVQSSATSEQKNNVLVLNYYQRNSDSTKTKDNFRAGLFHRSDERFLTSPGDSTGYSLTSVGANTRKWWQWGGLQLEAGAKAKYSFNKTPGNRSFTADDWANIKAEGSTLIEFIPLIDLMADGELQMRSDGFQSYQINAEGEIPVGRFTLTGGASSGTVMPTLQQLYWDSGQFNGNPDLENEKIQDVRGTLSYGFNPDTKIGVRAQHKEVADGIMMADSLFRNVDRYASQSATAFFEWDLTHFEFEGSAVFHRFTDSYVSSTGTIPMSSQERVWLKGSAYWKGYLFDRATYVKAGVSGMAAPFHYQADHYNPELNYWQSMSNDQSLPMFNRLDVDISARVRSIIFILRWENVLDDVSQLGYFETAQYPMSQRRFIFSVRALFRN